MAIKPVSKDRGVSLVEIPASEWDRFTWPEYQRKPNMNKVRQIANGLMSGYQPGPITVHAQNGRLRLIDGGHRAMAYRLNRKEHGIDSPILAIFYDDDPKNKVNENRIFILENSQLAMQASHIINANTSSRCCGMVRALCDENQYFKPCQDVLSYPIKPLSIIKAGVILDKEGDDIQVNRNAYLSVSKAIDELDGILIQRPRHWGRIVRFLDYIFELWGNDGRHLNNFGVLGFAYFLVKNRPRFFDGEDLVIKSEGPTFLKNAGQVPRMIDPTSLSWANCGTGGANQGISWPSRRPGGRILSPM